MEPEKCCPFWSSGTGNIVSLAGNMLQDFQVAQDLDSVVYCPPILQQWRPTKLNQHKVNFDAAAFKDTNSAGIGVVMRDWRGEFVGVYYHPTILGYC